MRARATLLAVNMLVCLLALPIKTPAQMRGTDPAGHSVALLDPSSARAVVLFFIASDCPISNRYSPEIARLEQKFATRGVAFWAVYPNATETPSTIRAHQSAYPSSMRVLTDPHGQLARLTGAKVTPEAAILLARQGSLHSIYAGRIDNRYLSIGNERPQATRHDLDDAISAVLRGSPTPAPGGPPIGCGIVTAP